MYTESTLGVGKVPESQYSAMPSNSSLWGANAGPLCPIAKSILSVVPAHRSLVERIKSCVADTTDFIGQIQELSQIIPTACGVRACDSAGCSAWSGMSIAASRN